MASNKTTAPLPELSGSGHDDTTITAGPVTTERPATARRPPALTLDQARVAWLTASRDTELDRWRDLYALAVPRPRTAPGPREEEHRS